MSEKIVGYKELDPYTVEMVNNVKHFANLAGGMIKIASEEPATDKRWVAIAKTDLQKGFMSLVRAWAKPESF